MFFSVESMVLKPGHPKKRSSEMRSDGPGLRMDTKTGGLEKLPPFSKRLKPGYLTVKFQVVYKICLLFCILILLIL